MNDEPSPNIPIAEGDNTAAPGLLQHWGLLAGPIVAALWLLMPPIGGMSLEAHRLSAVLLFTIIWWLAEPIPIAATGLLSVSLAVFLGAVPTKPGQSVATVALAPFANPSVFFLLGGMFLARGMTRHGLDRRLALAVLCSRWAGGSPIALLLGVGVAVGIVSMFVSNTAATAMIYPVVMGMLGVLAARATDGREKFLHGRYASVLLLMTAYSSSIGGISTPIGTATNVVAMGFLRQPEYLGHPVDFGRWVVVGLPVTLVVFALTALWLSWLGPSQSLDFQALREYLKQERRKLGPMSVGERNTLVVILIIVSLWITPSILTLAASADVVRDFHHHFPEEIIALLAPVLLYLLPINYKTGQATLAPSDFAKVDWSTMLLFGAGLSLGNLMFQTGLAKQVGSATLAAIGTSDPWVIAAVAVVGGIILSEFTSNAATASTLIPVIASLCHSAGADPVPALFAVTFGASLGSSLPVSTPPNAIVYGSRLIPVRRMIVAGLGVDILGGIVVLAVLRVAWSLGWRM